jgi:hypothetical protein
MRALLILVACSTLLVSGAVGASASLAGLGGVTQTLAGWRSNVGHGSVTADQKHRLSLIARVAASPTKATILRESVVGGSEGPAIYLDLVAQDPVWTLRHAHTLVDVLAKAPFGGGWAIRLRNAQHVTVWIAGHAANEGFVGSATKAIDAASPVTHGQPVTIH